MIMFIQRLRVLKREELGCRTLGKTTIVSVKHGLKQYSVLRSDRNTAACLLRLAPLAQVAAHDEEC